MDGKKIILKGVKVHNLKNVDLTLEHGEMIVFTGVSGSGKSSLAFDTIFIEGQRRYIESLSHQARQYLGDFPKPDAKSIEGITPSIAIEQKTAGRTPRSTVGTMTGIYDFLRLIFARVATPYCPVSLEPVKAQSKEKIILTLQLLPPKTKVILLAPFAKDKKGEFKDDFALLMQRGFTRVRVDGEFLELTGNEVLDSSKAHTVEIVVDRFTVEPEGTRITEAVTSALELGKGLFTALFPDTGDESAFSEFAYSPKSGLYYPPLQPQDFSFNHPSGMCPECQGLGVAGEFDLEKIIDPEKSIAEDCCAIASSYNTVRYGNIYDNLAKQYDFKVTTPWKKLSKEAKDVFLYGTKQKWTKMRFVHPDKGSRWTEFVQWRGVIHEAKKRLNEAKSDVYRKKMAEWMKISICNSCHGARIKPYPAHAKFAGKTLQQITAMTLIEAEDFFSKLKLTKEDLIIAEEMIKEIRKRLGFLCNVGLSYLTLDRTSPTLSGGESQRVRLASQIGSALVGCTYILDEPSIGLHPEDHEKLIGTLKALRNLGNTVIIVEHDRDTILEADTIVDVGPGAGKEGGRILSSSDLKALLHSPESLTGKYLSYELEIPVPKKRRKVEKEGLKIVGATHHNLKNVTVEIPLQGFIAITGVSGSGKSSLISDILYPALSNLLHHANLPVGKHKKIEGLERIDKVIAVDQSPIGRTPRSNPATYIKLFDDIRDLFTQLPVSQMKGFNKGHFSFNVKEGSCPYCGGAGSIRIDMDFMEDVWVKCPQCHGKRFDPDVLSITFKGHSISDILDMDVHSALSIFEDFPHIFKKLQLLQKVGLGYLSIGQPSNTLSGGEAQRIKLAKELVRPPSGQTLYILDEPSTGLHFHDLKQLLVVLHELISRGNTAIVIEHNMDVVKTADWIIDLGPGAGVHGGEINGEGTPEQIAKLATPTGRALKTTLKDIPPTAKKEKKREIVETPFIEVQNAEEHNLKHLSLSIPHGKITIFTGPSGSGKTSLAFDTIYAEGQRRYLESLSSYARQFVKMLPKPKVEKIDGLAPTIAIEQHKGAVSPRSTLGTMTETYDHLRLLYAHLGTAYSPETGEEIKTISKEFVVDKLLQLPENSKVQILSPIELKKETFPELVDRLKREGYLRIRLNGKFLELDEEISFDPRKKNALFLVIDRLQINEKSRNRLFEAVQKASSLGGGVLTIATEKDDLFFNLSFAVESTGESYPPITPLTFSFNDEQGMCQECRGLGTIYGMGKEKLDELLEFSVEDLFYDICKEKADDGAFSVWKEIMKQEGIELHVPLKELTERKKNFVLHGIPQKPISLKRSTLSVTFRGIIPALCQGAKSGEAAIRESLLPLMHETLCPSCEGTRLNPLARNVKIKSVSLPDFCKLSITEAAAFIQGVQPLPFLQETKDIILKQLNFLIEIGLEYLSLDRSAPTLSGGELQRVRLSKQLGSGLTSCIYVLDEPTIGLHPHNNSLLNKALQKLKHLGNTLLIVEHDPMTIAIADHIVDFGPKAGRLGGKILAEGTYKEILKNPHSITGAYLSFRKQLPIPKKRREIHFGLSIKNAAVHNLKGFDVSFPIEAITCITGVSGSGKSSLMHSLLRPALEQALKERKPKNEISYLHSTISGINHYDKLISIDQTPISANLRSDVSSYSDTLTQLRIFFAGLKLAKAKGLRPMHFSYHHLRGMCRTCWGLGYKIIDLQFLPKVKTVCESCKGYRLNPVNLEVKYKDKNLGELLYMSVDEARIFFSDIPPIFRKLDTLISVGLGYLKLGQEIASLSGGESQRIRLARELSKRSTGKTLYLVDEPSVGLHSEDLALLIPIFHKLVEKKNTLILIEHNLDLIANSDYLIDLGPEAGEKGGSIVATGTPEEVARNTKSYTGQYLKKFFDERIAQKH